MASGSPRKVIKAKRVLPSVPPDSPRLKSVTFNDEIVETSIGGTQRVGKIKQDILLHFDAPVTVQNGQSKPTSQNGGTSKPIPKSSSRSSSSSMSGKENKNVSASKQIRSSDSSEINVEETNSQNLSTNNNNSSTNIKESASPSKQKSTATISLKSTKADKAGSTRKNKNTLNVRDSSDVSESDCSINSQDKDNGKDSCSTEQNSNKPEIKVTDNRRTTMERIETVAQSPFRTPDSRQARRHTLESKMFATPDCYRDVNFGTPRRMLPMIQDESVDMTEDGEDSCSIMVAVRVRPFGQRELADSNTRCVVSMYGNETTVTSDNGNVHRFAYDHSFWSHDKENGQFCDQETVYTTLAQPMLGKAFEGYNTCLFAYGQTGSGKSYCIMGHANESGIIPRFCEELFCRADNLTTNRGVKINVEISFFEIYNEKIHDLLASSKEKGAKKTTLKVREHPVLGPYVEGLSTYVVNSFDDVEGWITLGNKNRATAATGMNDKSSRSHSVFTIVLTQTKTESIEGQEHDHSVNSKINLVDLAGSERQSLANTSGERLREGANINKSLLTLGKVISLLSERSVTSKKRKIFIPYRDSVLTWLLKESLGGNSKTAMIATISPASQHIEETLSTLRYAQQARSIVNMVRINEDPKAKIIRQLRAEIERLRGEQGGFMNEEALAASTLEIARLKAEMEELSRSWQERLRQAEAKKAEELQLLEKAGVTFKVDNRLPNLVNLNEDPQLSEMLLYVIKDGETRVGRKIDESRHDIKLTGALIADNHCVINSKAGEVKITPIADAPTYVNGDLITQTTILHHGDRVILGGDHYFRFNHPIEVQRNKSDARSGSDIKDFDFAKQELHRVQEARLQAELEEKLEETRKEMTQQKDGYENKLKGLEKVLTKVEQTHKEAQSTISDLKKQNMMLEQEVLAGRKRQKLESTLSQQALDDMSLTKSKIVELLEAETKQVAERLEKLRIKRSEMVTPARLTGTQDSLALTVSSITGSPASRRDLYKVALLLREANKINQYLNTNLVFSREDVSDEEGSDKVHTQIRVINTRHRMFTLWTVAKFEEKLAQMRDLYQNESDTSADDDEVFNDPEDVWEKETSVSSPACTQNGLHNLPKAFGLSKTTPVMNMWRGPVSTSSPRCSQDVEMSMVRACKSLLSAVGDSLTALSFEESVVDKVLSTCQRIKENTAAVLDCDTRKSSNGAMDTSWARPVLQLVADVHLLASHTTLWSSFYDGLQSSLLRDLLARSTDQVKVIGHQASSLLQGCEGKLTSLMSESGHKLTSALLALCETCGEMALATDSQVLRLDQSSRNYSHCQLSPEVSKSFLRGCSMFVTRTLEGGMASLDDCEQKCTGWKDMEEGGAAGDEMSQRLSHVLSCIQALLRRTLQVQIELDKEMDDGSDPRPPQYYSTTYKRLQGIVSNVSSVVDSSTLLVESAETIVQGTGQDGKRLERCAELIQKSSQRLLSVSSYTYTPSSSYLITSSSWSTLSSQKQQQDSTISSSSSSVSKAPSSSSSISSVPSQSDISTSTATVSVSSNSTISASTDDNSNNATNETDLTDVTLLSESQLGQLDSATHEVSMAMALFTEYARKTWGKSPERGAVTPRGRRLLPQSPEKSVVTPAMNAAHMRRWNIKRTIALASRDGKDT